ncbi:MAG: DUF4230 domain-containing protein [Phycisphaeraceae bacterium]|nr:DUF4230 domain-containing protein [Phycisphaeraceae bacterium]
MEWLITGTAIGLALGAIGAGAAVWWIRGRLIATKQETTITHTVAERVRAVGKLVGLEVAAKEIVTKTSGWSWIPPLLLSQARLAMIFAFEKQYFVDLSRVKEQDVTRLDDGRYRITLPQVEGSLRLLDVQPYDIQDGRILGLLDVIPMNADRQRQLMLQAQQQAAQLYSVNDPRYLSEARASIERHLRSLLGLFDIRVELVWSGDQEAESERAAPTPVKQGA